MCGISGIANLHRRKILYLKRKLEVMNSLLAHRGPDGEGIWRDKTQSVGLAHRRLSIIDLKVTANQPMISPDNNLVIAFNGEIYNYLELRESLKDTWTFRTHSDTEVILAAYARYGRNCMEHLRGMFAFALWDEKNKRLLCARDRFGIKPFYYTMADEEFHFASEVKALMPFIKEARTNEEAFSEYITFQYTLGEQTLISGIKQLMPGHALSIENGKLLVWRYWDVQYNIDDDHSSHYFENKLDELLRDSINVHMRSDVPVASYLSGGVDSSLMSILASKETNDLFGMFHGKFTDFPGYDESHYAEKVSNQIGRPLYTLNITADDFYANIEKIIYYLDFPAAGPGSFPQYMISQHAAKYVKVILGGQGGDELFGGYARYVLAYFEQCIKAAIEGTYKNGNFVVTPESIISNLGVLKEYQPMIKEFWREGLFSSLDARYFRLCDRSTDFTDEIDWSLLNKEQVFEKFKGIFNCADNVKKEAYFDKMTHFDFKCLLPALLQVEDRMSMAHGLESRVPLLDHPLVEFAATVPADFKFEGGKMKHLLKSTYQKDIPQEILNRRDKMGFPVPLKEWFNGKLKDMVFDILGNSKARNRPFINASSSFFKKLEVNNQFSRKLWALLCLELWYNNFHDKHASFKKLMDTSEPQIMV